MSEQVPIAIGIDVGGSGIKGAAVDLSTGRLASSRHRILTPQPSTPQACLQVIARIVKAICRELPEASTAPIGIGVPSVVIDGITRSAANIDAGWVGFDAEEGLERILGRPVRLVNDADAAGLAEMRFGAGRGTSGTVLVLTLGTGLGSGFFVDGRLVPNTELGHMEIRGRDAERRSAAAARVRRGLSWKAWAEDLDEHLIAIHRLFWPSLLILGGGVSKNAEKFIPRLTVPTPIVPAMLRNEAGIIGAALFAAETADTDAMPIPVAVPEAGSEAADAAEAERAAEAVVAKGPEGLEGLEEAEEIEASRAEVDAAPAEAGPAPAETEAGAAPVEAEPAPEPEEGEAEPEEAVAEPEAVEAEPAAEEAQAEPEETQAEPEEVEATPDEAEAELPEPETAEAAEGPAEASGDAGSSAPWEPPDESTVEPSVTLGPAWTVTDATVAGAAGYVAAPATLASDEPAPSEPTEESPDDGMPPSDQGTGS